MRFSAEIIAEWSCSLAPICVDVRDLRFTLSTSMGLVVTVCSASFIAIHHDRAP